MEDNAANVVMLGVMSNDTLYMVEEPEDVDMLDTDTDDPLPKSKNDEGGGFSGTLLSSTSTTLGLGKISITAATSETAPAAVAASTKEELVRSCSACTFNNVPDADVCEICSTRL